MFRVCLYIENGSTENDFDYVLSNVKPDEIYLMGCASQYQCTNNVLRDIPVCGSMSDLPDVPLILLAPISSANFTPTVGLKDFVHPADAIYIFGPNNEHVSSEDFGDRTVSHVVNIPTDTTDEQFNYVTYILTAWHRRLQLGG